jgi:putative ABC transport system substrate-binding protein
MHIAHSGFGLCPADYPPRQRGDRVRRREFIGLAAGAVAAWPLAARAQQKAMPVIGFLGTSPSAPVEAANLAGFRQGLGDAGYIEGQNATIEYRWVDSHYDRLPALCADLIARKVDLIVAQSDPTARGAKKATSTIPIVFFIGGDPVQQDLVASLVRPGGNLTGVTIFGNELDPKRLELLSELVPRAKTMALLVNSSNPAVPVERIPAPLEEAARTKGVRLRMLEAGGESKIDAAYATLADLQAGGLIVTADPLFGNRVQQLVALAARHSVPVVYYRRDFVDAGGLISYGPSFAAAFRQAGIYAGKILKGEKPADLPVQQPTKFELVINLKTAKALGLRVPQSLLARADEVIE